MCRLHTGRGVNGICPYLSKDVKNTEKNCITEITFSLDYFPYLYNVKLDSGYIAKLWIITIFISRNIKLYLLNTLQEFIHNHRFYLYSIQSVQEVTLFYMVTYYIKWLTTSWTDSKFRTLDYICSALIVYIGAKLTKQILQMARNPPRHSIRTFFLP